MKNSTSCAHVLHKTLNFSGHFTLLFCRARAERLFLLINLLFCGVLVAVAVAVVVA